MERSVMEGRCSRHPTSEQAAGVCPFCLTERLAHLSAASSATATVASSNTSSPGKSPASNFSSAIASAPRQELRPPLRRHSPLTASMQKEESHKEKNRKKATRKKWSFWSKMMSGSSGRRREAEGDQLHS
ncbi:hypothetical protein MUK42_10752 [Musa troglodytarum]|uniref:Uncharacterized protein n=1 Tax=Musa troglodytarum TaxID=320322 RepID=A0A9E7JMK8_9LILI|nr:hypothetical protein MUK42_10752 [Musa troglodytarum]